LPVHINDRPDFGVLVRVGHFARGPVIVIAEALELVADLVGHLEGVKASSKPPQSVLIAN
jgi:hypothetical protein